MIEIVSKICWLVSCLSHIFQGVLKTSGRTVAFEILGNDFATLLGDETAATVLFETLRRVGGLEIILGLVILLLGDSKLSYIILMLYQTMIIGALSRDTETMRVQGHEETAKAFTIYLLVSMGLFVLALVGLLSGGGKKGNKVPRSSSLIGNLMLRFNVLLEGLVGVSFYAFSLRAFDVFIPNSGFPTNSFSSFGQVYANVVFANLGATYVSSILGLFLLKPSSLALLLFAGFHGILTVSLHLEHETYVSTTTAPGLVQFAHDGRNFHAAMILANMVCAYFASLPTTEAKHQKVE